MKKLTILMLVVVMVLGLMLLAVGAREPVNKVTGEIEILFEEEEFSAKLVFDVYETEDDATKGTISWFEVDGTGPYQVSDVLCCNVVDENTAWFVIVSDDPNVWIVIKVVDDGSPGAIFDELHFDYVREDLGGACAMVDSAADDLLYEATITEGNLVVHYTRWPVNKIKGKFWAEVRWAEDGTLIQISYGEFDAFERDDDKGYISMWWWTEGEGEVNIQLEVPVLCCNVVDENTAWFAWGTEELGCTVAKVVDGGFSGAPNDEMSFESFEELVDDVCYMVTNGIDPSMEEVTVVIVGGNIVVHYYGE